MLEDAVYYSRREDTERGLARHAVDERVREIHLLLAEKYAELARRAMAAMPISTIEQVPSVPAAPAMMRATKYR